MQEENKQIDPGTMERLVQGNEQIGYYRSISNYEEALKISKRDAGTGERAWVYRRVRRMGRHFECGDRISSSRYVRKGDCDVPGSGTDFQKSWNSR